MPGCVLAKESRVASLASAISVDLDLTGIATAFVGPTFTLAKLRVVYEDGWVIPTGRRARPGATGGKPAELYRAGRMWKYSGPIRRSQPNEKGKGNQ
jgi:hypothetical protein